MYITLNNSRFFFDVYGSSLQITKNSVRQKPTLLVLHGGHGIVDHTLYVDFWSQFSDMAQVVFLDQRGCGRSDKRQPEEWNLAHWGEDIHLFCQALGIEKPIIAGISMGGHAIGEYLTKYASEPGGLIFCNTEARTILEDVCKAMEHLGGKEAAELTYTQFTSPTPETTKQYQKKCVPFYAKCSYSEDEIRRCLQRPEIFTHYSKNEMQYFNYLNVMKKITCPTLFMVGEESPLHPPVRALEMAEEIKKEYVCYHLFKQAGAPVYKDAPEEAYQVVRDFITSVSSS